MKKYLINFIYKYYISAFFSLVYWRDLKKIEVSSGPFEQLSTKQIEEWVIKYDEFAKNICGETNAEIVFLIHSTNLIKGRILLDGDSNLIVSQFCNKLNMGNNFEVVTTGLGQDKDFIWDFENEPPREIGKSDLIVSQAMIEHLLDPYKHIKDLSSILNKGGFLILHSVMPGYTYHRYPIDAIRFYPDWFEMIAPRLNLTVVRKFRRNFELYYLYKKM